MQHYAARHNQLQICEILLKNGADIAITTRSGKATALHRAAFSGHMEVVKLLADFCRKNHKNDVINSADIDGQTFLHSVSVTAEYKQLNLLSILLGRHNSYPQKYTLCLIYVIC